MSSAEQASAAPRPPPADAAQNATALFEQQLRVLSDSYLSFFQERRRIEEQYVASLMRLHRKSRSMDSYIDDRMDPSTTRIAWNELTDNVEREAGTHQAFLETLSAHIIDPLSNFKEEQDRIRKRIREDIKDAVTAHADYADNVLPRLKRAYIKKCQETEEYKAAAAAPLSPTSPDQNNMPPLSKPQSQGANGTRPVVTGPQPLRPLDRRPSQHQRNRSPSAAASTSTALQDLAHQGKRQLNQLMTFLDRDREARPDALRQVRAKREADEADKEYRRGVHWLETLRIRRVKIVESGFKSLEAFVHESSQLLKRVMEMYNDSLTAAAATQGQLCEHCGRMIEKVNPQRDTAVVAAHIPRLLAAATPKPVCYYNYNVGECKDLIFGVSLVDYATARGQSDGDIPKIVRLCIEDIDKRGLDAEGIYRISGRHAAVQELQHKIERNESMFQFNPQVDDVYCVSSFLKLYLRELPEPVFKFPLQERMQHTEAFDEHLANNFTLLRSKIRRLPQIHQATLKAIVEHLARIASHSDKNKMDPKNLAIVFGSVIFGEDEIPKGGDLLGMQAWKDTTMEDLITHANVLFQQSGTGSPPLPPAPLHESAAHIAYGSTHTKLTSMPPPPVPTSPRKTHQKVPSVSGTPRSSFDLPRPGMQELTPQLPPRPTPQDFTPSLPPRPTNSIHPSLRAGPHASSPARQGPSLRAGQFFDDQVRVTPQSSLSPTYEGSVNTSNSSLATPPSLKDLKEEPPLLTSPSGTTMASTRATSPPPQPTQPHSRAASTRSTSSPIADAPDLFNPAASVSPDAFPVQQPAPPQTHRTGSHESGMELSSTATAAAFASASPSPPSSASGHSSPSKRSAHGRKQSTSD